MDSVAEAVENFTVCMDQTENPDVTSPSQLEEVTLDPDSTLYTAGLRSPIHGARGRSIKEFEEQLSGLRKENFNLKLRIYFLEERMGSNCNMDQEDAVKKNIELMVELESLKKEVQEKQDLLCQAVKAMELEEDEHRKENDKRERDAKELRRQLDALQEELQSQAEMREREYFGAGGALPTMSDSPDRELVAHLENRVADLEEQLRIEHRERDGSDLAHAVEQLRDKLNASEERLRDALCDGDAARAKIARMEAEARETRAEVGALAARLEQKHAEARELQQGMADLRKLNDECTAMYEAECKRSERGRVAIANRNAKIGELESSVEKHKTQVANLELKLETAVNEVKLRGSPSHAEHSPAAKPLAAGKRAPANCKSKGHGGAAAAAAASGDEAARHLGADELGAELVKYKHHVNRLEQDQLKACKIIQTMLETRKKNGKEIEELQRSVQKRDALIGDLKAKLADAGVGGRTPTSAAAAEKKSIQERVSELNLTAAAPSTDTERAESVDEHDPHLLLEQYKQFISELDLQKQKLAVSLNDKDVLIEELEAKYEDLYRDFKAKENRIVDLEFELLSNPDNDAATREKADRGSEKDSFWIREIEEKDKEMERLEEELAKRTTDLQGVINNELWQKNREIERLQRYVTSCDKKDVEIANLQKEVAESENKLLVCALRIKEYEEVKSRERYEIQEKLNTSNEDRNDLLMEVNELNNRIASVVKENAALKEEVKLSDSLRTETQEVCAMLGKRLEEIATFLDTLLKQKSVLGFLGHRQNRMLKQRVEQSLDLTRNLSITLQMSADQSLLQLSNISELLNATAQSDGAPPDFAQNLTTLSIVPDDVSLTYRNALSLKAASLRDDQSEVIGVLRAQIDKLKGEIEIRDHELAQRMSLSAMQQSDLIDQLAEISAAALPLSPEEIVRRLKAHEKSAACDNSDSESWSEPDRDVSKARIGLDDNALRPKAKMISESTEMERPVSRTPSKKSVASETRGTISQLTEQLGQKDELIGAAAEKCRAIEERFEQVTRKYEEVCAKCTDLEASNADLNKEYKELDNLYRSLQAAYGKEKQLLEAAVESRDDCARKSRDLEEKMRAAVEARTSAENDVVLLNGKIENLESYKVMFTESMETKTKFIENRLNELEAEKGQALQDVKVAEAKLDDAMKEIARITEKLLSVEYNHAKSTSTIIDDAEKEVQRRVSEVEKDFDERVRSIEHSAQREVLRIREAAENIAIKYEKDYVERSEMERLKAMIAELESVQDVLKLTEQKARQLEASEVALKQQLFDAECAYRNSLNDVRRELDSATLQVSQLQLEKTTAEDERAHLQAQLKQYNDREELFETQVADLKNDFAQLKENFRRQLHTIETEKSHLEVKTSSLQALNADLQSQIVKMQCSHEASKTHSAPPTPTGRILNMYLSKNQIYRQPNFNDLYHRNNENVETVEEVERIRANSSPDLGIESDQGRFSSLETNVVARPLQPSIDLAVSMNENLEVHAKNDSNCGNDKCSRAVKDMHNENSMLKKKLLKSNKLLEETLCQLAKANQRKREVEKNICKQIHKTSQVLKAARANLDSGSENELVRK